MLVASKFEEILPPSVQDFVYITADAYTKDELIRMEIELLSALEFQVSTPTAAQFFDRVAQYCDEQQRNLAQYLLELTLTDYSMSRHLPSHVAAASLMLAKCVQDMRSAWIASQKSPLQAVRKKFRHSRYNAVADAQFVDVCVATDSMSSEPVEGSSH